MTLRLSRYKCGKVEMSCVDPARTLDALFAWIEERRGGYIACACAHGIVESERDLRLREILNRSLLTLPDGMPTVWVGRLKGYPVRRVTAPDFLEAVMAHPRARGIRHYFYGASEDTLTRILARARASIGAEAVAGGYSPPLRPVGAPEDPAVLARIAAARPDIIWVGLGLPKQEYWMERYSGFFPNTIMVGVGAAFDWYAGDKPRAPAWIQLLGLEWLHRVASEPARLWPRYRAIVPPALRIMAKDVVSSLLYARRGRSVAA